jgi:hypothetical protein
MPRLNLSDAEAEAIVRWRQSSAVDTNWNAALELARTIVDATLSKMLPAAQVSLMDVAPSNPVPVASLILAIKTELDKHQREIKLP